MMHLKAYTNFNLKVENNLIVENQVIEWNLFFLGWTSWNVDIVVIKFNLEGKSIYHTLRSQRYIEFPKHFPKLCAYFIFKANMVVSLPFIPYFSFIWDNKSLLNEWFIINLLIILASATLVLKEMCQEFDVDL